MLAMDFRPEAEHTRLFTPTQQLLSKACVPTWPHSQGPQASGTQKALHQQQVPANRDCTAVIPISALAETADSEASTSGRSFEECQGATSVFTGIASDPAATFVGVFRAAKPGAAQAFLQQLTASVKECSKAEQLKSALLSACKHCLSLSDSYSSLSGCASLISKGTLTFCTTGDCLVALGIENGKTCSQTELLSGFENRDSSEAKERGVSLAGIVKQAHNAFGSIIPLDRATVFGSRAFTKRPLSDTRDLTPSNHFLLLGVGPVQDVMTADSAVASIQRFREQPSAAGQAATLLAAECHKRLAKNSCEDSHVTVAIVHFKLPALPLPSSHALPAISESVTFRSGSPPRYECELAPSLPPLLLSPSGRRVHFLQPLQGSEVAPHGSSPGCTATYPSPFTGAADRSLHSESSASAEEDVPSQSIPDSSGLISSGSLLSQPNMSIPEEDTLPKEHSAMQLPPPLLLPIKKAYPSGELRITADMMQSPSPPRKALIGRAASMNSPEGLVPLPLQPQQEAPIRQTSGSTLGSRSRGGEEGRVRGGLPRIASVPSQLGTAQTPSPTLSNSSSPQEDTSSGRTPFADITAVAESTTSASGLLASQDSQGSGKLNPWGRPVSPQGRKTRGQSAALRMLQAGNRQPSERDPPSTSAPGDLESAALAGAAIASSASDLQRVSFPTSGTDSVDQSVDSQTSNSTSTGVRRVPVLEDSLKELSVALPKTGQAVHVATSSLGHSNPSRATEHGSKEHLRRSSSDVTGQRQILPAHEAQITGKFGRRQGCGRSSWPELDSAASDRGLLVNSLSMEGRQHSGQAFSSAGSLADSVGSLTLATAACEQQE